MKLTRLLLLLPLALLASCKSPAPRPDLVDIQRFTPAAERGEAWSQYELGRAYATHWRYSEANNWYRKAALQGQRDAMYWLGLSYLNGLGTPKNTTEAYAWFNIGGSQDQLAARNGRETLAGRMTLAEIEEGNRRAAALLAEIPNAKLIYENSKTTQGKEASQSNAIATESRKASAPAPTTTTAGLGKDQPMRKTATPAPKSMEVAKPISSKAEATKPAAGKVKADELQPKSSK